jgi:hypothetical protein
MPQFLRKEKHYQINRVMIVIRQIAPATDYHPPDYLPFFRYVLI